MSTHFKNPTQCTLWKKHGLMPHNLNLDPVEVFNSSTHLKRDLFRCRECRQLYFHEWYEHVNFRHDNYMYGTYIPVESQDEIARLLRTKNSAELLKFFPQLHGSFLNGLSDSMQWIENDQD